MFGSPDLHVGDLMVRGLQQQHPINQIEPVAQKGKSSSLRDPAAAEGKKRVTRTARDVRIRFWPGYCGGDRPASRSRQATAE
jgi:hypothetical protein